MLFYSSKLDNCSGVVLIRAIPGTIVLFRLFLPHLTFARYVMLSTKSEYKGGM